MPVHSKIILIDGHCVLCNGFAKTILTKDKKRLFSLGTLQSKEGAKLIALYGVPDSVDSIVYLENEIAYTHSTAALKILSQLPAYNWAKVFYALPKFIRDWGYKLLAKNRYNWFGRKDECMLPSKEERERFI